MRVSWRLLAGICLTVGCARGTAASDGAGGGTEDESMSLGGEDAGGTATTGDDAAAAGGGNANGNDADEGQRPDAMAAGGTNDSGAPDGAIAPSSCDAQISCEAASKAGIPNAGSIEWAQTTTIGTKKDAGNRFYMVSVTGDSAGEVVKGGIEARLTSPAGTNYDVYVYGGAEGYNSGLEPCEEPTAASDSGVGGVDTVSRVWAAAAFGLLSDRAVTVEVRHVSGPCAAFNLELSGKKE